MQKKEFLIVVLISMALSALVVCGVVWYGSRPPSLGGDFTLNHRGKDWNLAENAKKLNLVYVGYAKCPDVCPMSLSYAAQAFRKLSPDDLEKVQFIFISVDVENDTAESVADYAANFYPLFIGLTGKKEILDQVVSSIGASYMVEKNPNSYLGYSIAHSDRIFLLNKKGFVIDTLPGLRSDQALLDKLKELL
jgi:protein SCO1